MTFATLTLGLCLFGPAACTEAEPTPDDDATLAPADLVGDGMIGGFGHPAFERQPIEASEMPPSVMPFEAELELNSEMDQGKHNRQCNADFAQNRNKSKMDDT